MYRCLLKGFNIPYFQRRSIAAWHIQCAYDECMQTIFLSFFFDSDVTYVPV